VDWIEFPRDYEAHQSRIKYTNIKSDQPVNQNGFFPDQLKMATIIPIFEFKKMNIFFQITGPFPSSK
jgi:hypothetical protein